jgi:hypothetical protein
LVVPVDVMDDGPALVAFDDSASPGQPPQEISDGSLLLGDPVEGSGDVGHEGGAIFLLCQTTNQNDENGTERALPTIGPATACSSASTTCTRSGRFQPNSAPPLRRF